MPGRKILPALAAVSAFLVAAPARAYVDMAPTLAAVVRDARVITVAEVERFNAEKGAVLLKKVRDLKGEAAADPVKHQVLAAGESAVDRTILEWAEPGSRCVLFVSGPSALVCVGRGWYQVQEGADGWWRRGAPRPDLPLAYYGPASRLGDAVALLLAGKSARITTLRHGAGRQGASFDLALNRSNLPGSAAVQRVRADMRMPTVAMAVSASQAYLVGDGQAGEEDIPDLRRQLQDADAAVRAESAADLGSLGARSSAAADDLAKLLEDPAPVVRTAAAAALLRVNPREKRAADVLAKALDGADDAGRRQAARAVALAGPVAAPLAGKLIPLLAAPDLATRRAALEAFAALGPAAAGALDPVVALLDKPETAVDAADALGRMGPAARPAVKRLARMLEAGPTAERWAGVRAMAQIGGEDAAPAVAFMVRELPGASEVDSYNMMIYLALLGPVARDALPAIRSAHVMMNPVVRPATIWAIEPDRNFPWLEGGPFGGATGEPDFARCLFESYVQELGDRLKPAAAALAGKIMDGSAGDPPPWAYKLLARFPEESLAVLVPGLESDQTVPRERAAVALGYMGRAAAPAAAAANRALARAPGEKEQRLLRWCLREIQ